MIDDEDLRRHAMFAEHHRRRFITFQQQAVEAVALWKHIIGEMDETDPDFIAARNEVQRTCEAANSAWQDFQLASEMAREAGTAALQ